MSRLLYRLIISSGFVACGGEATVCGSAGAPEFGLSLVAPALNLGFGQLMAGANNDCPDPAAPSGVVSLTIAGTESSGNGLITFCVARPDRLTTQALPLGSTGVRLIDLNAAVGGCTYAIDTSQAPSGTVRSSGMCANGTDPRGFVLTVQASVKLRRTCGAASETIDVALQGDAAVAGT